MEHFFSISTFHIYIPLLLDIKQGNKSQLIPCTFIEFLAIWNILWRSSSTSRLKVDSARTLCCNSLSVVTLFFRVEQNIRLQRRNQFHTLVCNFPSFFWTCPTKQKSFARFTLKYEKLPENSTRKWLKLFSVVVVCPVRVTNIILYASSATLNFTFIRFNNHWINLLVTQFVLVSWFPTIYKIMLKVNKRTFLPSLVY